MRLFIASAVVAIACNHQPDRRANQAPPTGAAQPEGDLAAPVAKVDDTTITVADFQERLNRMSPYVRHRYRSIEQRKDFLDNMIRFEVLAKEAKARGFDKDPDVVRAMKQKMVTKMMQDEFATKFSPDDIPEAELKAYYDSHRTEYNRPEEVRVSAIVLTSAKQAEQVAKLAKAEQGKTNKGFRDLVEQYSTDEDTKLRSGDLRYFASNATDIPSEVVQAAFALAETGQVAGPIAAGGKFYVIKQTGKRRAAERTFEQVKRQIQNKLYREQRTRRQNAFVAELRAKAKIELFDQNLPKVKIDLSASENPEPHGGAGN